MSETDVGAARVGSYTTGLAAVVDLSATGAMRTTHAVPPGALTDGKGRVLAVCGCLVFPEEDSWPRSASRPGLGACHDCAAHLLDAGAIPRPRRPA